MRAALVALVLVAAGCAAQPERVYTPREAAAATSAAPAVPTPVTETIAVGEKMKIEVEWPAAPDPILKAFTRYYVDSRKAVVGGGDDYLTWVEGPAAKDAYDWVHGFRGRSMSGTAKIYALTVSALMGKGAQINACVDETGLRLVSKSGQAYARQPEWTRESYLQAVVIRHGDDGVWRIKDFRYSDEGCDR
ncbi:hypothetical protein [Nonomuraea typhae]|uniref:hypothetical protein n=1 Tax=Nonomuraea typhae TaxID=2603600 RepID=UPI0012F81162|nr:hypothetical protein [Nonomuraea typhae]